MWDHLYAMTSTPFRPTLHGPRAWSKLSFRTILSSTPQSWALHIIWMHGHLPFSHDLFRHVVLEPLIHNRRMREWKGLPALPGLDGGITIPQDAPILQQQAMCPFSSVSVDPPALCFGRRISRSVTFGALNRAQVTSVLSARVQVLSFVGRYSVRVDDAVGGRLLPFLILLAWSEAHFGGVVG
jgi:hypothetical protein